MQKILLIGELEEIIRSVNECLENDFQVQICSEKIDMVRGMAKIVKPDLIIVCQIGIDELNHTIFTWVKEQMPKTPVLIISTEESWGSISGYCTTPQFERLFRPVTGSVIVKTCKNMLACGKGLSLEKEELTKDGDGTQQAPGIIDKKRKDRERIMIVDDNPLVLRNMKSILEQKYDIFLVPSGEKALELIPKKHPDLVLLDYEMPGMDGKAVFDAAFAAVDQVVKDGMGEEEKVKAIHDYLIYHANYVNNGDYSTAENWAYGAGGVLLHKEGVCQSYAFAFYMMAISAGLECRFVSGTADGGGHAWNQVKVNGKWYYIDCTWDDPVGGGYENYKYYLSESLWADHIAETAKDLAEDGKYDWEHYYLTGADYAR